MNTVRAVITVSGYVQGIGYRYFAIKAAKELGLKGAVRNLAEGKVEVVAEGPKKDIEELVERLRGGHYLARVEDVDIRYGEAQGSFNDFSLTY